MFVISKTHVGMVRTVNEDALLTTGPELFALADGMGGYAAGETASREALQVLQQEAEKFKELTGTELCTAMRETVQQANKHIRQMAQSEVQYHDMGTTLVAVYLAADGKAYAVNVGDSRLYTWSAGTLQQVTRDHSYVAELLANGEITAQEAFKHPQKNICDYVFITVPFKYNACKSESVFCGNGSKRFVKHLSASCPIIFNQKSGYYTEVSG